jgi:hypothetical protein
VTGGIAGRHRPPKPPLLMMSKLMTSIHFDCA